MFGRGMGGWGMGYGRPWRQWRRMRRMRRWAYGRGGFCCLPCCSLALVVPAAISVLLGPILIGRLRKGPSD